MEALLNSHTDIHQRSQIVNRLKDPVDPLAKQAEINRVPAAMASLKLSQSRSSLAYLDAAQVAADWFGTPTAESEHSMQGALAVACRLLAYVEDNHRLEGSEAHAMGNDQDDWLWTTHVP